MADSRKNPTPPMVGQIALDQPLDAHHLAKLVRTQEEHTARVLAHREALGAYPDPNDVEEFDDPEVTEIVFPGKIGLFGGTEPDSFRRGRNNRRGQNRGGQRGGQQGSGKGKGKSGGSGGGTGGGNRRPLPDPKLVHQRVAAILAPLPHAGMQGNVQIGLWNAEFLDPSKLRYFQDSCIEIASRFHVLFLEEVDPAGVAAYAKVTGHAGFCSTANTRAQAVGFLVHPRLRLVGGPTEYTSVANVQGIPDLRPAFRLDLEDTVTGEKFSVTVLHLKSMRGGPAVTANVRYRQFQLVVQALGPNYVGFVGGDLNYKIDDPSCREADPMIQAGYTLVAAGDNQATQIMGSRIDGVFTKGLKSKVDYYRVFAYFADAQLKRSLSDHGTLKVELLCSSAASNQASGFQSFGTSDDGDEEQGSIGGVQLPNLLGVARVKGNGRTSGKTGGRGKRTSRKG